ncbi:MAG: hypothetical protein HND44_24630 [Chloroflexi bacterium]|nr:hypothetical protein [Ardenticatenaceae bacterium]MBL1131607.1 hypothetical protein [Chloroflexota bacterium]NOG37721.1 hypothetical protein [Chloroflexota bacterium]
MKRAHNWFIFLLSLILALVVVIPAKAATGPLCYVDATAMGANNGDTWADAYPDLTAALSDSNCTEIWVAAGVYQPGAARTDSFVLADGVAVYGGFAGVETALVERDWKTNVTILSGDIDNNDVNADGNHIAESTADIVGDNSYHVVIGSGTNNSAILDGFIITAGQANGLTFPDNRAGGIYNNYGEPTLQNLVFSGNYADTSGGAIYNYTSDPIIANSVFVGNAAGNGGAIDNYSFSDPILTNVVFSGNTAFNNGGALRNLSSWPALVNVTFSNNTAAVSGGAMHNGDTGTIELKNTIMWGNTAGVVGYSIFNDGTVTVNISYSNIQYCGGSGGGWDPACGIDVGSNIDLNPMFIDEDGGDDIIGTYDDNLRLDFGSPSIETGTNMGCPTADFDSLPRPADADDDSFAMCDMGAYEAGSMVCGVVTSGVYPFNYQSNVEIIVDNQGPDLACLYVDEMGINHPNATGSPGNKGIATGRYWLIRGLQSDKSTDASGFVVTLTLPHSNLPDPKVCKYPGGLGGAGWDCDATITTPSSVTRSGITAFSDWAVGSEVGPTAVTLLSTAVNADNPNPAAWPIGLLALLLAGVSGTAVFYQRRRRAVS